MSTDSPFGVPAMDAKHRAKESQWRQVGDLKTLVHELSAAASPSEERIRLLGEVALSLNQRLAAIEKAIGLIEK